MISKNGETFLHNLESCSLEAYLDIAGIPTIGWGNTIYLNGARVKLGDTITQRQADALFLITCQGISKKIDVYCNRKLNVNQHDALVSFCYNVGTQAFKNSTLLRLLNNGVSTLSAEIEVQWMRWDKAHIDGKLVRVKGLKNRRRKEYSLFIIRTGV